MVSLIIFNRVKSELKKHGFELKNSLFYSFETGQLVIDGIEMPNVFVDKKEIEERLKGFNELKIKELFLHPKRISIKTEDDKVITF